MTATTYRVGIIKRQYEDGVLSKDDYTTRLAELHDRTTHADCDAVERYDLSSDMGTNIVWLCEHGIEVEPEESSVEAYDDGR